MPDLSWEFVAVVTSIIGIFSAVILLAVRYMLQGHREHVDLRITGLSEVITVGNDEVKRIERDLTDLKIDLPNKYVRREDWIRFASVIDAKQDALGDKLSVTNEKFERLLERIGTHE